MKDIIRIDLPRTKYLLRTEAVLYKLSIPDFAKLLKIIGEQADPYDKPAETYYSKLRELIAEAKGSAPAVYECMTSAAQSTTGFLVKKKKVETGKRLKKLEEKLDAAERKWVR